MIRAIVKRLSAGKPVYADLYDENKRQQQRLRVVRLALRAGGEVTLYGINGEVVRLHPSRIMFTDH